MLHTCVQKFDVTVCELNRASGAKRSQANRSIGRRGCRACACRADSDAGMQPVVMAVGEFAPTMAMAEYFRSFRRHHGNGRLQQPAVLQDHSSWCALCLTLMTVEPDEQKQFN